MLLKGPLFSPLLQPTSAEFVLIQLMESISECCLVELVQRFSGTYLHKSLSDMLVITSRRSVVLAKKYVCRKANQGCRIDKSERYLCRLCRYNKCLNLGMTADSEFISLSVYQFILSDVQWNRDMISSTDRKRHSEEDYDSDSAYSSPGAKRSGFDGPPLYDLTKVLNKIHKTFNEVIR